MAIAPALLIDDTQAAFLQGGVSISAASSGVQSGQRFPSLCRVLACQVAPDRRQLTVLVSRAQAVELLRDVGASGRLSVVFSQPSTHRTLQIKGEHARIAPASAEQLDAVRRHRDAFVSEVVGLGFPPALVALLLTCDDDDILGISYTPVAVFDQSPGPRAGSLLQAAS
jgi:hypothetical protein